MVTIKSKSNQINNLHFEAYHGMRLAGELICFIDADTLHIENANIYRTNHHETDSQIKYGLIISCLSQALQHGDIRFIEAKGLIGDIYYPEQLFLLFGATNDVVNKFKFDNASVSKFAILDANPDAELILSKHGDVVDTYGKVFKVVEGCFETRFSSLDTPIKKNGMELFSPRERFKRGDVFNRATVNSLANGILLEAFGQQVSSIKPIIAPFGVSAYHGYILSHTLVSLHDLGWFEYIKNNSKKYYSIENDLMVLKCNKILQHLYDIIEEAGIIIYSEDKSLYSVNQDAFQVLEAEIGYVKFIIHGYNMVLNETKALAFGEKQYWKDIKRDDNGVGEFLLTYNYNVEPAIFNTVKDLGFKKMAYLGCGNAKRLIDICKANPNSQAVGVEIDPVVAAKARENIAAAGMADRIQIVEEDLMEWAVKSNKDVDTVLFIMGMAHDFLKDKKRAHTVFYEMKKNLAPGARMILEDINIQEKSDPWSGMTINKGFELVHALMGVNLGTRDTYVKVFEYYGWEVEFVRGTGLPNAWIYCIKSDIGNKNKLTKTITTEEAVTL